MNGRDFRGQVNPTTPLRQPKSMKVSAEYAEAHFADLLHAADPGEEVEIARPDKPSLKLAPPGAAKSV